jgi:hypothetical protein
MAAILWRLLRSGSFVETGVESPRSKADQGLQVKTS